MAVFEFTAQVLDPASGEAGTLTASFIVEAQPATPAQQLDEIHAILNA
jgi:hypothetical protein